VAVSLDKLGRYEESLAIRRDLYERDPTNVTWQGDLVWGLGRMGNKTKDPKYYEEALPIRRAFAKDGNEGAQRELAFCLYMIGTLYEGKGDLEKALPALREAEKIHRAARSYRNEYHFWADAYFRVSYNAACEAAKRGDKQVALAHLKENLEWSKEHVQAAQFEKHREHARKNDPDLESLRGMVEFEALFE
jgi:tetratricopeptide (TPR) repeat protein